MALAEVILQRRSSVGRTGEMGTKVKVFRGTRKNDAEGRGTISHGLSILLTERCQRRCRSSDR
jgi:hypothetical protein